MALATPHFTSNALTLRSRQKRLPGIQTASSSKLVPAKLRAYSDARES